ncbi:Fur family transcriptional regulator [Phycisphaerales bacterium AB-hyl4]|uniref:Fur family transcriptional regulator n=1 Tax=Natronomicrosphaera hydrolytica TaxID=3242702 RepID=A0ABV4TZZ6_9BACT
MFDHEPDNHIEVLFSAHNLRCTRQRKAIYAALEATREHPTADDLFRDVGREIPGMSLATVYNTLEAFCRSGLVQKLPGAGLNGSARYDAVRDDHLHLRCRHSGAVADVPESLGDALLRHLPREALTEIEHKLGFRIEQIQVELVGEFEGPRRSASDS